MDYHAHGLAVSSELDLPLAARAPGPADLVLRWGPERPVPAEHPPGTTLATLARPDGSLSYGFATDGERTVLRYPGLCEFVGDSLLRDISAHPHPGVDRGLVAVLAAGAVLAVHLMLREALVLHASAVAVDGRAVAFVGGSGMGKSTLAAALCDHGCGLVTDDVMRVDPDGLVYPGSLESRLRIAARQLADDAPAGFVRSTADGRLAVRARASVDGPVPLAACVVPRPSRDADEVMVRLLPPARALLRLSGFPRVLGWRDRPSMDRTFQALADLVERVPVFDAVVPWGPPFRHGVLDDLLAALDVPVRSPVGG